MELVVVDLLLNDFSACGRRRILRLISASVITNGLDIATLHRPTRVCENPVWSSFIDKNF